jgi:hypothetical protein
MTEWKFVLAAYTVVFGTLAVYWWRVESAIHALERQAGERPADPRW